MYRLLFLVLIGLCYGAPHNKEYMQKFSYTGNQTLRIIGGKEAAPHQFPYEVAIYIRSKYSTNFCGGSLISKNYVLTAAHCVVNAVEVTMVFGAHNIKKKESTQKHVTSQDILAHPDFDEEAITNDIALIKLPQPMQETDAIKIVKIADGSSSYANQNGIYAGWGTTSDDQYDDNSPVLRYIQNPILSNSDCYKIPPFDEILQKSHLCLSGRGTVGMCLGDSGGPLVVNSVQVGLAAFGYRLCETDKPTVFTRITDFYPWIKKNSDI